MIKCNKCNRLAVPQKGTTDNDLVRCPHCGSDDIQPTERIQRWLSLFLLTCIISPLCDICVLLSTGIDVFTMVIALPLYILPFYVIWAFHKRDGDAVFLGKLYAASNLIIGLMGLLCNGVETKVFIRGICYGSIWLTYLSCSCHVSRVIPKDVRKLTKRSIVFLVITLGLMALVFWGF